MEVLDPAALERDAEERNAKQKAWAFWATFEHDPDLPPATWTVDGEVQEVPLTEENLRRAVMREGRKKAHVAVSAPLHIDIVAWIGWHPPLVNASAK